MPWNVANGKPYGSSTQCFEPHQLRQWKLTYTYPTSLRTPHHVSTAYHKGARSLSASSTWCQNDAPAQPPPLPASQKPRRRVQNPRTPKKTRLTRIAERTDVTGKRCMPSAIAPWEATDTDPPFRDRLAICKHKHRMDKKEAAKSRNRHVENFKMDTGHLLVYTDGSQLKYSSPKTRKFTLLLSTFLVPE